MKVCLIYSGWLRTREQCRMNQAANLIAPEFMETHINEYNTQLHFHTEDIERYNERKAPETVVRHTMNQWRNQWLSFQLAPKDCDIYVRIRYDIIFFNKIFFENYAIHDDIIYIPYGHEYRGGCCDMFAFGNYKTMEKYFNVYLNHEAIYNGGTEFHTEQFVKQNMLMQGVKIEHMGSTVDIVRP